VNGDSVIIIDETLAAAAFPGVDPIDRMLRLGWGLPNSRVVGVVGHARVIDVSQEVRPQIYVPYGRFSWGPLNFTVRTEGDPLTRVEAVREAVRELGTGRAVSRFQLLTDNVTTATSALRSVTIMVSMLAVSAALLCALGLYAVVSYVVHERRRATAIRGALGATPGRLLGHHLRNGIAIVAVAIPIGVALSVAAARFFSSLVYEIGVRDVRSLAAAAALAALTGLLGTYFPARRAANADPAQALRSE
jgi:putative ABC transport system permease protein